MLASAEAAGRMGDVVEMLALKSLAHQAHYQTNQALAALVQALNLAEPEGYIRTFVDEGPAMGQLLSTLSQRPSAVNPNYLETLLAAFPDFRFTMDDLRDSTPTIVNSKPENVFLPAFLNGALAIPLARANGIASFFGLAFIGGSLLIGFSSDRLQVRKPFILIGALMAGLMLLFVMGLTPAVTTVVLTLILVCLGFSQALGNVTWLAAFTQTAEEVNPALIGTALAIMGAILRFSFVVTAAGQALVIGNGEAWATWWWICLACLLLFLPSILLLTGDWRSPWVRAAPAG